MMTVVRIEYVDHGVAGEYGFFGKRVAASDVRGMTAAEREREVAEMKAIVGEHVHAVEVEEV
jgi:hypothetical protein